MHTMAAHTEAVTGGDQEETRRRPGGDQEENGLHNGLVYSLEVN